MKGLLNKAFRGTSILNLRAAELKKISAGRKIVLNDLLQKQFSTISDNKSAIGNPINEPSQIKESKKLKAIANPLPFPIHNIITTYSDIHKILANFTEGIKNICNQNLISICLSGSITYGDFNYNRSDIDIVVILNKKPTVEELKSIKNLHKTIETNHPIWGERLECSYIAVDLLVNISPPEAPRPYYNSGAFYDEATYGNEWIINNYLLYRYGVSILGPSLQELVNPIDIVEVQKACIKDLLQEWKPKITDPECLSDSYYQSYIILNLCRILYSVMQHPTGSKTIAALWVKQEFGQPWQVLIEAAEKWEYGKEINFQKEVILFIKFVIKKISETQLFKLIDIDNKTQNIDTVNEDFLTKVSIPLEPVSGGDQNISPFSKFATVEQGLGAPGAEANNVQHPVCKDSRPGATTQLSSAAEFQKKSIDKSNYENNIDQKPESQTPLSGKHYVDGTENED